MQAYMGLLPAILATELNLLNLEYPLGAKLQTSSLYPFILPRIHISLPLRLQRLVKKDASCLGAVIGEDRGSEVRPQAI